MSKKPKWDENLALGTLEIHVPRHLSMWQAFEHVGDTIRKALGRFRITRAVYLVSVDDRVMTYRVSKAIES